MFNLIIGLREIQIRRFERQWKTCNYKGSFIESTDTFTYSSSDEMGKFLAIADLCAFEHIFLAEGVTKISHLADVTQEDLAAINIYFKIPA